MIVVDANVAIKWFIPEPGEAEAKQLLQSERRLIAPEIIQLEVLGAVLRHYREGKLSERRAGDIRSAWNQLIADGALLLRPDEQLFDRAFAIAVQVRHALADCLYVALAEHTDAELITTDEPLLRRGGKVHARISLLRQAA